MADVYAQSLLRILRERYGHGYLLMPMDELDKLYKKHAGIVTLLRNPRRTPHTTWDIQDRAKADGIDGCWDDLKELIRACTEKGRQLSRAADDEDPKGAIDGVPRLLRTSGRGPFSPQSDGSSSLF